MISTELNFAAKFDGNLLLGCVGKGLKGSSLRLDLSLIVYLLFLFFEFPAT